MHKLKIFTFSRNVNIGRSFHALRVRDISPFHILPSCVISVYTATPPKYFVHVSASNSCFRYSDLAGKYHVVKCRTVLNPINIFNRTSSESIQTPNHFQLQGWQIEKYDGKHYILRIAQTIVTCGDIASSPLQVYYDDGTKDLESSPCTIGISGAWGLISI